MTAVIPAEAGIHVKQRVKRMLAYARMPVDSIRVALSAPLAIDS